MRGTPWIYVAFFILGTVLLVVALNAAFPGALNDQNSQIDLVRGLLLLVLVSSSVVLGWRSAPGLALKQAFIWLGIFIALIVVYSYRFEFGEMASRVGMNLSPTTPVQETRGVVSIGMSVNGHFQASTLVNGTHVMFLVDTGASSVVLTEFDAKRLGFRMDELTFNIPVSTANGMAFAAPIRLDEIKIGDIEITNVPASVMGEGLESSLLGMSYLSRLSSFTVDQDRLILRQ